MDQRRWAYYPGAVDAAVALDPSGTLAWYASSNLACVQGASDAAAAMYGYA